MGGGIRLLGVYYYYYDLFFVALPSIYRVKSGTNCEWLHHTSRIQFIGPFFFPVLSHSPFSPAIRCDWLVCVYDTAWRGMEGPEAGGSI